MRPTIPASTGTSGSRPSAPCRNLPGSRSWRSAFSRDPPGPSPFCGRPLPRRAPPVRASRDFPLLLHEPQGLEALGTLLEERGRAALRPSPRENRGRLVPDPRDPGGTRHRSASGTFHSREWDKGQAPLPRRSRLSFWGERLAAGAALARPLVPGGAMVDELLRDLRFGVRQIRRNPFFALVVVLTLGLGIGANAAIFTLLDQILVRGLPVPEPERLVLLDDRGVKSGSVHSN